jgi:hypothetical protein
MPSSAVGGSANAAAHLDTPSVGARRSLYQSSGLGGLRRRLHRYPGGVAMTPNIGGLREASRTLRDDAYRAADQMAEDCNHSSAGSDARAHLYALADRDFHDRNAAIDRLANAPQHPVGNPDSNEALRFLASMEVDQPPTEPAPRNRMENGPRGTFTGTAAEFLELKRLGTMTPEELEASLLRELGQGSPVSDLLASGDTDIAQTETPIPAPPQRLLDDIAATLARGEQP